MCQTALASARLLAPASEASLAVVSPVVAQSLRDDRGGYLRAGKLDWSRAVIDGSHRQALADTTRRPVKVIHGVDGKPHRFLPALAKHAPGLRGVDSLVWVAVPEPLATVRHLAISPEPR